MECIGSPGQRFGTIRGAKCNLPPTPPPPSPPLGEASCLFMLAASADAYAGLVRRGEFQWSVMVRRSLVEEKLQVLTGYMQPVWWSMRQDKGIHITRNWN